MATMIKNERQYRITRAQADKFETAIREIEGSAEDGRIHPKLRNAQIAALRSQLSDLRADVEEYEALKSGKRNVSLMNPFADVPRTLIQARIAAGLSQEELADRLSLKAQQIQRYEATDYSSASLARV